jgi:protein gp37
VPFFFKQWGEWLPVVEAEPGVFFPDDGTDGDQNNRLCGKRLTVSADRKMARVGKALAGRALDGREWNEWPLPF